MRMTVAILTLAAGATCPPARVEAQHEHSPYAGLRTVEGTSMTAEEVGELRSGAGMRLALPAELNGYPGPRHVIDMAEAMGVDPGTLAEVERVRAEMASAAIAKGEEVIAADRELARAFREGGATDGEIERLTGTLARARGELQAIHLEAHLRTRALLTSAQVESYRRLRGYGPPAG